MYLSLDGSQRIIFARHFSKLQNHLPKKRLMGGSEFLVEETGQGRIICLEQDENIVKIIHIFAAHKEYEKWYKSFK